MFAGFLNSMESIGECSLWAMCEAGREAALLGRVGRVVAMVASDNAEQWMKKMISVEGEGVAGAVKDGVDGADCDQMFSCHDRPGHYRFPGI